MFSFHIPWDFFHTNRGPHLQIKWIQVLIVSKTLLLSCRCSAAPCRQRAGGYRGSRIYLLCWKGLFFLDGNLLFFNERNAEKIVWKIQAVFWCCYFPLGFVMQTALGSPVLKSIVVALQNTPSLIIPEVINASLCPVIFLEMYEIDLRWK